MSFVAFDDLLEEQEIRFRVAPNWDTSSLDEKCAAFEYFCENYWHIRHPTRGRIKFKMSQAQRETVRDWLAHRYSIVLKARQLGFSTLAGAFTVWCAFFYSDRYIIMLSRTERDAIKLLEKAKYGFKYLPQWMLLRGPVWDMKQTAISFSNDSKIESLPSGNEPARGETVWLFILDEWAFLPNPDEAWAAIEPAADIGGRVIGLSTANGEGNIFYDIWSKSSPHGFGTNKWHSIFHPWWADGEGKRDADWYAEKQRDLPDWQLAQEYPDNPEEAFLRSGRPMFKLDKLKLLVPAEPTRGYLLDTGDRVEFREEKGGNFSVWEFPQEKRVYVVGCDVAEGLEHGDYTSVHVIDAQYKNVVAAWHGHIDPDLLGEVLLPQIGRLYNNCLIGVESNNHGLTTLKALQRAKYRNIFRERPHGKTTAQPTDKLGFRTTKTSKPLIIDGLGAVIREERLGLYCRGTIQELKTFVREGDGKMHGSPYDDRTMSLAIGVHMLQFAFLDEYKPKEEYAQGTFGWWEKLLYKTEKKAESVVVGAHSSRR
jgi:hypothetical protein